MKEKVVFPKIVNCFKHNRLAVGHEDCKDCKDCKKINKQRKNEFLQQLTWKAGGIIYKYWPEYFAKAQKKHPKDIQAAAMVAKKSITEQLYPWIGNSKTAQKIWDDTLSKLIRGMHDSFIPVIETRLDIAQSKKTGQQIINKKKTQQELWR